MKKQIRPSDDHWQSGHRTTHDPFASEEPSWFLKQEDNGPHEELVARYRLSRNTHDRGAHLDSQKRPERREFISARPRPPARFLENSDDVYTVQKTQRADRGISLKQTFALAAVMAVISGGTVGFLSSQYSTLKGSAFAMLHTKAAPPAAVIKAEVLAAPPQPQELKTVPAADVPKKPVSTATLEVNDVSGATNSLIPLLLNAEPALASQDLIMKISGLPEGAYLTSGTRGADKVWALTMDDLKNVKLMIPEALQPNIDVSVAAFEKDTGELAAPVKTMTIALSNVVVQPVAAPPPQQIMQPTFSENPKAGLPGAIPEPATVNLAFTAAQQMASQHAVTGDSLLQSGDIDSARKSYQLAWTGGSPDGALGMAKSYDPVVLAALNVKGAEPSGAQALAWYQRAATAGKTEALSAIIRLRMKPE